jgi:hypothetical protein
VFRERPDQAERDNLVRQPSAPVRSLGNAELLVEPKQVLLDRRLRHHEVVGYVPRGGGHDERVVGQRRTTQ